MMTNKQVTSLEHYFQKFRSNIVGIGAEFETPNGLKSLVYADWVASGRLYGPIEDIMWKQVGPRVGNTHSESSYTGKLMTRAYHEAHAILKNHVNASSGDVIITSDSGMTGVLCKFQRILGLKLPEKYSDQIDIPEQERPVVFVTHMEHHSNQTSWLETIADVVVLEPTEDLLVDPEHLTIALEQYKDRKVKIGSFTACSNVTGIVTPYHRLAEIMHDHGGYCFVDFAASAPYTDINMHPEKEAERLDAIFFSPHKFLGGPGSSGVLVFDKKLYKNRIPDHPGGGTVAWTNPWGGRSYFNDIEVREDGGTPGFLQAIRAALAVRLKEKMTVEKMMAREEELISICFTEFTKIPEVHVLAEGVKHRLGVFSFYVENIHHNLMVKLLNDRYGIQVRGGCSCAGTYGHLLLHVSRKQSRQITNLIDHGDLSQKPGWVRLSLHPTMTNDELYYIMEAIEEVVRNAKSWAQDYRYSASVNEFYHRSEKTDPELAEWFEP
ncbi:aminotransferase class V-fold PLP-dependent enzyme [Aliifodinibius sp. S!AR15-10]|uniref:aminotransferase class V-fold PLP-dependent enzyme n=1 Tax=Aliifodinibius sp. S!AR15-10 TaxID=2950437 RepID=UPI002857E192|nr:aminotransferase class V-fold PLP-dependent enzyme [Aliifodinibius sp. S!AR15-10]MDR8391460.1 aminotransferase class V-fold PLP-dependent enzyme [Aliifodinibius sp. S!AR15-10]